VLLENIRDISIIVLAIESIVIGVILLLLLWQIRALALLLKHEVKPILEDTQETARTVQVTTKFVGQSVAKPAVNAVSFAAGIRRTMKSVKEQVADSKRRRTTPTASSSTASGIAEEATHE